MGPISDSFWAAALALGTASTVGVYSLIIRRGETYANAPTGVLIGLIVSVPLLVTATTYHWDPAWWNLRGVLHFIAAGLMGPAIGRVFLYMSIQKLGVSRALPLISVEPLVIALIAYGSLGERPGPAIWTGTVLIAAGCAALSMKGKEDSTWDRRSLWMPFAAVAGFSLSIVIRKVGIAIVPSPLFGVTATSLSGLVFLSLFVNFLPPSQRPQLGRARAWYFYGVCGLLITFGFFLHFVAIYYGDLTIVAPLTWTAPFFSLVLSWIFLRDLERVTGLVVGGTVLTVLGAALIGWRVL